ncbi:cuticle protein CP575-like [Panulirus ornatus]|uniref:cuticle protein CP575-like n=1 Tax=Panulirus ornatus TaxID=150431 RepID=UPI003A88C4E4
MSEGRPGVYNVAGTGAEHQLLSCNHTNMKFLVMFLLGLVVLAAARPNDIIDIDEDHMEHEQEGIPGTAVEGEYTWVAPDGTEHEIEYVANKFGFQVVR